MNLILIGGGGHASVLVDIIHLNNIPILGYTDVKKKDFEESEYLGKDEVIQRYSVHDVLLVNGMGSTESTMNRKKIYEKFKSLGYSFYSVIHPKSIISLNVQLSEGVQIMAGVVINPGVVLAENTIINTSSSIDHDCNIGAHSHIAPGVTLSGNVTIGSDCHIGSGTTIIQNVVIGDHSVIGAGSVVLENISSYTRAWGVPAKGKRVTA